MGECVCVCVCVFVCVFVCASVLACMHVCVHVNINLLTTLDAPFIPLSPLDPSSQSDP